jgi:hypothetical protein
MASQALSIGNLSNRASGLHPNTHAADYDGQLANMFRLDAGLPQGRGVVFLLDLAQSAAGDFFQIRMGRGGFNSIT